MFKFLLQVFRQYESSGEDGFGELEWLVGPIPVEDGGKEIIMRYDAKGFI